MNDVEILAVWMQLTCIRLGKTTDDDGEPISPGRPFAELPKYKQEYYRVVAREMLTNPPEVLVNAILAKPTFLEKP